MRRRSVASSHCGGCAGGVGEVWSGRGVGEGEGERQARRRAVAPSSRRVAQHCASRHIVVGGDDGNSVRTRIPRGIRFGVRMGDGAVERCAVVIIDESIPVNGSDAR